MLASTYFREVVEVVGRIAAKIGSRCGMLCSVIKFGMVRFTMKS
jgi:hypothetical protein